MAICICKAGMYVGKVQAGRVRHIRELDPRPLLCDLHRWDDRTIFHYDRPVDREIVELWDLIFRNLERARRLD